ncbi:MAG: MOSC domain-containing protein [Alphaproteobacteria bacterium]|nr:MOSC domain-containing protein [Alphaproteobacteria bacterium]MBL6936892.1 MOSC domain-containing protein [Alphaproteobacteria bacterium]MBL7097661.1 MOSC domain-containing protein [Alphaproteobacteria bacterium]
MKLKLRAVSVGLPRPIARAVDGEIVMSAIAKQLVTTDRIFVGRESIEGDGQADLRVHGGRDKAVYAYPADHWPWWQETHRLACAPNTFGENLTLEGTDESAVSIGDRFRWGDALLEISQPRAPCFKLGIHAREDIPARMTVSARCGWYFRVVEVGFAPVDGEVIRERDTGGPNVRETFIAALHPNAPETSRLRVRAVEELSPAWKRMIR